MFFVLVIVFIIFINCFFEEFRVVFDLFIEDGFDVFSIENLECVLKICGRELFFKDLREVICLVDYIGLLEFILI